MTENETLDSENETASLIRNLHDEAGLPLTALWPRALMRGAAMKLGQMHRELTAARALIAGLQAGEGVGAAPTPPPDAASRVDPIPGLREIRRVIIRGQRLSTTMVYDASRGAEAEITRLRTALADTEMRILPESSP